MKHPEDIAGIWRGSYFFDLVEQHPSVGAGGVPFEVHLRQNWWQRLFGHFTGSVTDDASRGMPGIGVVRGECHGSSIRFIKEMPVLYVTNAEGRLVPLSVYLREHGYELGCEFSHPPIIYQGSFATDTEASGSWVIEAETLVIAPNVELPFGRCTGTFTLTR